MRRTIALLGVAAVGITAHANVLDSYNRVVNGDVETQGDPNRPADWSFSVFGTSWDTTEFISPTRSLKIDDNAADQAAEWRSFPRLGVAGGEILNLSYFTKYDISAGNFGVFLRFWDGGGGFVGQQLDLVAGVGGWEHREFKTVAPPTAQTADVFIFTNDAANQGVAFYDDFAVDDNLLFNSRFEIGSGAVANDWFTGADAGASAGRIDLGGGVGDSAMELVDGTDSGGADIRSLATVVTGETDYRFSFESLRENVVGDVAVFVRWFSDAGATAFIDQETLLLAGNTAGFETIDQIVTAPAGAIRADVVFWTRHNNANTGRFVFDDVLLSPTIPTPGAIGFVAAGALVSARRRR